LNACSIARLASRRELPPFDLDGLSRYPVKKLPGRVLARAPRKGNKDMQYTLSVVARRNSEAIKRKFSRPFGYQVTFQLHPGGLCEARWSPDVPLIRKAPARRKFFEASHSARRFFLDELAAVVDGDIVILDISGLRNDHLYADFVRAPTRH
jgi:hypothetical protein